MFRGRDVLDWGGLGDDAVCDAPTGRPAICAGSADIFRSTSGTTTPTVVLADIKGAESVRERLRGLVEQRRDTKHVRELDVGHEAI